MRLFSFWKDDREMLGGFELSSPVGDELTVADFSCVASAVCVGRDIMRSMAAVWKLNRRGKRKCMHGTQSPCGKEVALQELKKGMQTEFVFVLQIMNPCKLSRLERTDGNGRRNVTDLSLTVKSSCMHA